MVDPNAAQGDAFEGETFAIDKQNGTILQPGSEFRQSEVLEKLKKKGLRTSSS